MGLWLSGGGSLIPIDVGGVTGTGVRLVLMVSGIVRVSQMRRPKMYNSDWNLQNGIIKSRGLETQALKGRQNRQHRTTEPATLEWLHGYIDLDASS